jgi:hypothetical protein
VSAAGLLSDLPTYDESPYLFGFLATDTGQLFVHGPTGFTGTAGGTASTGPWFDGISFGIGPTGRMG